MIDINELRDRAATFGSDYLTDEEWVEVIDRLEAAEQTAQDCLRIDGEKARIAQRLEAAEKAVTEAYRRGYETGQEEIAAELEFAKREVANLHDDISEWMDKCDALRAKITEMEQQAPVAEWAKNRFHRYPQLNWADGYRAVIGEKLYALPGAQPAPSVPDGWKLVPMVSTHEMKEAGACAGAVYYAIAKDVWSAMLAAAPEAKP